MDIAWIVGYLDDSWKKSRLIDDSYRNLLKIAVYRIGDGKHTPGVWFGNRDSGGREGLSFFAFRIWVSFSVFDENNGWK